MDSSKIDDRLSELPDSLLLEILSLLPMPDVVATMLLSKHWVHLWTTVPCLRFSCFDRRFDRSLYKYPGFVRGALAHWKGSKIHKFSLTFYDGDDSLVDSCLLLAIEKQVEVLHVYKDNYDTEYCPPDQPLCSCSSITKMSLYNCKLKIDVAVQWNRLKSLVILRLDSLSEDALNRILAGAPLLEELILNLIKFSENLNIRSTSLKKLEVGAFSTGTLFEEVLRIWAPNLVDLELFGSFHGVCLLDVPSLTNAELSFHGEDYANLRGDEMFHRVFQSIRHVEKLTLSDFNIKTLLRMKQNDFLVEFSNAKSLYLYAFETEEMLGVLDMFPNPTTLWVQMIRLLIIKNEEKASVMLMCLRQIYQVLLFAAKEC